MRYLEDFEPGTVVELGSTTVDHDEVVAFAERFDPQPFHVDEVAARSSIFGGIVASGWHVGSLFMRLFVDAVLKDVAVMAGATLDDVRLVRPVRPGDTLSGSVEIVDVRPSQHKPDRGTLEIAATLRNQDGDVVMTLRNGARIARRPAAA